MLYRLLAIALLASACGTVTEKPTDAAVGDGPGDGPAVMWRNQPSDVMFVMFGGPSGANNYCQYKITLKQLDVQLAIQPSGQVTSGHVQDLNFEEIVPPCSQGSIPANIAMYQLATAAPSAGGMTLTFQGGASNSPPATLVVDLTKINSLYSATLTFHRNDGLDPVLEWMVMATVPLSPQ
jgi:hypothetical protein